MRKLIIISMLILVLSGPVTAIDFTETTAIPTEKTEYESYFRMDTGNNGSAEVIEDSNTEFGVEIYSDTNSNKSILIAKSIVTPFENDRNISMMSDGIEKNYSTTNALNETWIITNTTSQNTTIKFIPSELSSSDTSLIEYIKLKFLQNPITYSILLIVFILIIAFLISRYKESTIIEKG